MPRWARSTGVLAAAYVAVMAAAALWAPHEWDWTAFGWFSGSAPPAFSDQVRLVDVEWDPTDVPANRRRVAGFLRALVASGQQPSAVILDVEFDPCQSTPCGEPMESAREALAASVRAAAARFPVFAAEEPAVDREDEVSGPLDRQDPQIYAAFSGAAHTRFIAIPHSDGIYYRACYANVPFADEAGNIEGSQPVWAMVDRVLMPSAFVATATCDPTHLPVRLGEPLGAGSPALASVSGSRPFPRGAEYDQKYVIVGTLPYDRSPFTSRSNPEILGWALSNALDRASPIAVKTYYDTHAPGSMLLLLVPAFSALAVLSYAAIFLSLKRMRLRAVRPILPWLSAAAAAASGLAIFVAFEWVLFALFRQIQPQVSLISLGIVLASGLSGFRGHQLLVDEGNALDHSPAEVHDYDVFVSYAREEGAWVAENVYRPLAAARLPNGRGLSIFFDTSSIRVGTGWQDKISLAIDGSRFVVPVYSDIYFTKPYCRFEIRRAHRKWIALGEDSRCVLPVMRGKPKIYATVDDIQALSIDDHPDLVQTIVDEIVERTARTARAARDLETVNGDAP